MAEIHPLAHVAPSAEIGAGTKIGPFALVGPGVVLGRDNELRAGAMVDGPGTTLGDGNVLFSGCVVGGPPQDKKYRGGETYLTVGDGNVFREHVTVHRGTENGGFYTRIGDRNLLLAGAHIAHDCEVRSDVILSNNVLLAGHVLVEDKAVMAGAAAVHHFGTVGELAYVGGLSRINRDAPPFMFTEGNPSRIVKVNRIGLERHGIPEERIEVLRHAFRHLFRGKHPTIEDGFAALDRLGVTSPELTKLRDFMEAMRGGKNGRALEATR